MGLTSPFWGGPGGPGGPCLGSEAKPKAPGVPGVPALVPAPLGKPGKFHQWRNFHQQKWLWNLKVENVTASLWKQGYPLVISLDLLAHLVRWFTYQTADFHGLSISQITTGIYKGSTGYLWWWSKTLMPMAVRQQKRPLDWWPGQWQSAGRCRKRQGSSSAESHGFFEEFAAWAQVTGDGLVINQYQFNVMNVYEMMPNISVFWFSKCMNNWTW